MAPPAAGRNPLRGPPGAEVQVAATAEENLYLYRLLLTRRAALNSLLLRAPRDQELPARSRSPPLSVLRDLPKRFPRILPKGGSFAFIVREKQQLNEKYIFIFFLLKEVSKFMLMSECF